MGFRTNGYGKVWDIRKSERGISLLIECSRKKRDGDGYDRTFRDWVPCRSTAAEKAAELKGGERIHFLNTDLENNSEKQEDGTWVTRYFPALLDFEIPEPKPAEE